MTAPRARLLYSGPFHADQRVRARDALCAAADAGARDILWVAASGAAGRSAITDLLARRGAVFGLRVVTMKSIVKELARRARVPERDSIDAITDELLVERAVRSASGKRFDDSSPVRGLATRIRSAIDLLERNGASHAQLAAVMSEGQSTDGARMLVDAWAALAALRPRHGLTEAARLGLALELVRARPRILLGLDLLVLEDVPLLATVEHELIAALVSAAPGDVVAAHGHVPQLASAPSTLALQRLRAIAPWNEISCSPGAARADDFVGRLFAPSLEPRKPMLPAPPIRITRLEAAGDVGEVRLAARVVRRHLDDGVAPDDIALVVHSVGRYRELVYETFAAAGIPVGVTLPRSVADSGLGSVLLRLLDLAIVPDRMTRERSLAVARAVHVDLAAADADRLEHRIITGGFLGLDGWDEFALQALGERATNRINRLKRAVESARRAFDVIETPADAARATRRLAKELRLVGNAYFGRRRVARKSDADDVFPAKTALAVREDNEAWELIAHALDTAVPTLLEIDRAAHGQRGMALAQAWRSMLGRVMRSEMVAAERTPAGAVRFCGTGAGADRPARVTIVLGMLEKSFPRQSRQDPFLHDALCRLLRERHGWQLITTEEKMDRERECFVRAVASATESLYLSCAATDAEGKAAVRSFFVDDLRAAVGADLAVERSGTSTAIAALGDAASPGELMAGVAHDIWQHLPRDEAALLRRSAAFAATTAMAGRGRDLSVVRHGRRVSQQPAFDPALFDGLPHRTLRLSASQLKSLGHCTYAHFVEKVLSPQPLQPPEYDALSKGSLIHAAIMEFSSALRGWERGEEALDELQAWVRGRIERWTPAERGSARARQGASDHLARLDELVRAELAMLAGGGVARPAHAELAFGEQSEHAGRRDAASVEESFDLGVSTSLGDVTVYFRGSMDRVDVIEIDGRRYGVIIDYKTGETSRHYAEAMMKGHDLQLRLYLMVLQRFWGIEPVGALYLGFGDGVRRGAMRAEFAGRFAGIDGKSVKLLDDAAWREFIEATPSLIAPLVDRLVRLDITPRPRDGECGFCELKPICRYERWTPEPSRG